MACVMSETKHALELVFEDLKNKQLELIEKIKPREITRKYVGQMEDLANNEYGFQTSYENWSSIDVNGQPIPWMTYSAVYYLSQLDLSSKKVFEWGSGNSSLYFSTRAQHVTTVESDINWYNYVLEQKEANNVVFLKDADSYACCIDEMKESYDVISIDGDIYRRLECAVHAITKLNAGGIIILDNSDWLEGTCEFLRGQGFTQIDFAGPGPINEYMWCTSIFFKGDISIGSKASKRPSFLNTSVKNSRDANINNYFTQNTTSLDVEKILTFNENYERLKVDVLPTHTDIFSSQEGEDVLIRRLLKWHYNKPGFYIDVGAHDPIRFSNTYHYYLKGWKGINIDPRPNIMKYFNDVRTRDINLELGIAGKAGHLKYYEFKEPAFNTFDEESVAYAETRTELETTSSIRVEMLRTVLDEHMPKNVEITFLNVDVEGLELDVIASSDWLKYRPKIVCVEALDQDHAEKIELFMETIFYVKVATTKNSYFFCETTFWDEVK